MSFLTREQRYQMLCAIKRGGRVTASGIAKNDELTEEEEQFIQDYAQERLFDLLKDPEVMAVFNRMKDR